MKFEEIYEPVKSLEEPLLGPRPGASTESLSEPRSEALSEPPTEAPTKFPIKLMIGIPCYDAKIPFEYISLLPETSKLLEKNGIYTELSFLCGDSLVTRARNSLVAKFLSREEFTHFMFIDADILWNPQDILTMIQKDKDVIGGIYPKKKVHWDKIPEASKYVEEYSAKILEQNKLRIQKDVTLEARSLEYVVNTEKNTVHLNSDETVKVLYLGTGFMMIKREVFEKMKTQFPFLQYTPDIDQPCSPEEREHSYAFFDADILNKRYLSEDYVFCKRYLSIPGNTGIWTVPSIQLTHIGTHRYRGNWGIKIGCSAAVQK